MFHKNYSRFQNGRTPKSDCVKVNDIPINLLTVLPKAPRTASEFPASWDWNILYENADKEKSVDKLKQKNTPVQVTYKKKQLKYTDSLFHILYVFQC